MTYSIISWIKLGFKSSFRNYFRLLLVAISYNLVFIVAAIAISVPILNGSVTDTSLLHSLCLLTVIILFILLPGITVGQTKAILNIDTGMNRLGLNQNERHILVNNREMLDDIEIDYIMSHLANAQDNENENNLLQLNKLINFSKNFPDIKLSLANSGGIKLGSKFCLDQTRPGIGLYGIDNFGKSFKLNSKKLKFPLKLLAPIIQIKNANAGEPISYGGIDILKKSSTILYLI